MTRARIALGTAQLGLPYGIANDSGLMSDVEAHAILDAAVELDVLTWDTAPAYGSSESRIGSFLARRGRPAGLKLCTKLPAMPAGLDDADLPSFVAEHVDASRRALHSDCLDVYLLHSASDLRPALLDALVDARSRGWIGELGLSIYERPELDRLLADDRLVAVQLPFSVFNQSCNTAALRAAPKQVFARSVLLQGLLSMEHDTAGVPDAAAAWLTKLIALCNKSDLSPVTAALRFAATRGPAQELVLGVLNAAQLRDAVSALESKNEVAADSLFNAMETEFAAVPAAVADPRCWQGAP